MAVFTPSIQGGTPQFFRQKPSDLNQLRWLFDRAIQQYVVAVIPSMLSTESIFYGASPPVANGDIGVLPLRTSPGNYAVVPNADGTLSVLAGGDTTRQSITIDVYDLSASAFFGQVTDYINNIAPTFIGNKAVIAVERGQTITPVSIAGYWVDQEGDSLAYSLSPSSPALPGTVATNAAGLVAGTTPNANSITSAIFRATDIASDFSDGTIVVIVGNVIAPDVQTAHPAQSAAQGAITAAYLSYAIGSTVFSATVPVGCVVSQSPAPGNEVAPFSTITLTISGGATGPVSILSQPPNPVYAQGSGLHTVDLAQFFSGASAYSIAELTYLLSIGGSLAGSLLSVPTDTAGTLGPFTATGSSNTDTKTLNPFTVFISPAPAAPTNLGLADRPGTTLRNFLLT